ncbi:MAG: hypothetical protein NC828_04830 [Candidatus Omnitrophica bacterium]|nr:hypothetical protein [Candidatus Omnitrophota bacterium]
MRKRPAKTPEQVFVYEPKEYQREPNPEIYKRSFLFWKAWQKELVDKMGENKASDQRAFQEALKNLNEMKTCLDDQKANELDDYIQKIASFYNLYKSNDFSIVQSRQMRQDLDRLMLKMDKLFRYNRVMEHIK